MTRRLLSLFALAALFILPVQAQPYTTPQEVLQANLEATGGADAWRQVTNIHRKVEVTIEQGDQLMMINMDDYRLSEGYTFQKMQSDMFGEMMNYATPEGGFRINPQGRQELTADDEMVQDAKRPISAEIALLDGEDDMTLDANGDLDGLPTYIVQVGDDTRRYYDKETLLIAAIANLNPNNGEWMVRYMEDHREVDGLTFAFFQSVDMPQVSQSIVITEINYNTDITPEALAEMAGVDENEQ